MKLRHENRKKLNAVRKAMLLGVPITGMMLAGYAVKAADKGTSNGNDPAKRNTPAKKTISIDTMSLFHSLGWTSGIMYPPPVKVEQKITFFAVAVISMNPPAPGAFGPIFVELTLPY